MDFAVLQKGENMDDLIGRRAALDALEQNEEMINIVLDSLTLDYNSRTYQWQRRAQIKNDINTIRELPSAQPKHNPDEWCTDCKEYDHDRHCCPRWNRVIRETLKDAQQEIICCRDCKHYRHNNVGDSWCCHPRGLDGLDLMLSDFCSKAERK